MTRIKLALASLALLFASTANAHKVHLNSLQCISTEDWTGADEAEIEISVAASQ